MTDQYIHPAKSVPMRLLRHTAALALCPITAYFLAYVALNIVDLFRGLQWHLFRRHFGIGLFSMFGGVGHHQWSVATIVIFYIVCMFVALPLIAIVRSRTAQHSLLFSCIAWGLGCGTYFLLIDIPYGVFWKGAICGLLAGAVGGALYYFIVYEPMTRNV